MGIPEFMILLSNSIQLDRGYQCSNSYKQLLLAFYLSKRCISCDHPNSENHLPRSPSKLSAARQSENKQEKKADKKFQFDGSN